jgi:hypothetical protein
MALEFQKSCQKVIKFYCALAKIKNLIKIKLIELNIKKKITRRNRKDVLVLEYH